MRALAVLAALGAGPVAAQDAELVESATQARQLIYCAAFAGQLSRPEAGELLAEGFRVIGPVIAAIHTGTLDAETKAAMPYEIAFALSGGPSVDFSMGFLWGSVSFNAFASTEPADDLTGEARRAAQEDIARLAWSEFECEGLVE